MFESVKTMVSRWRPRLYNLYTLDVQPRLPVKLRRILGRPYGAYVFWRIGPRPTNVLGPRYRRSRDRIDIDVTWDCNLHCYHCSRSCRQAPTDERMSLGQIRRFLTESQERSLRWKEIHIIGGEPILHPDIDEIIRLVLEYRARYSPGTNVKLTTNGYGEYVAAVLRRIPAGVDVRNTNKADQCQEMFVPFNLAPHDLPEYANVDFRNACAITRDSGIGLSPYGYYPCVVAGSIDRVIGFDCGRKTKPEAEDGMEEELARFCSLCGCFRTNYTADPNGHPTTSATWDLGYAEWRRNARSLTRFAEEP